MCDTFFYSFQHSNVNLEYKTKIRFIDTAYMCSNFFACKHVIIILKSMDNRNILHESKKRKIKSIGPQNSRMKIVFELTYKLSVKSIEIVI